MRPSHDRDMERHVWDTYAEKDTADLADCEPVFDWTQYPGHGPGMDVLGDPASVLELGCGAGRALACLAQHGVKVRGVDLSPVAAEAARERWGPLGVDVVCADVLDFLREDTDRYDAVYSVFGGCWFVDPAKLLPLVLERLTPGGVLAFSQPPAIPGAYGPQGMYKGGFSGPECFVYRYDYTPPRWESWLLTAGFARAEAAVWQAPTPGHVGTLLVRGERAA